MTETLLSPSSVLLFGRKLADLVVTAPGAKPLKARLASTVAISDPLQGHIEIDGEDVKKGNIILLTNQANPAQNKLWEVRGPAEAWAQLAPARQPPIKGLVRVKKGDDNQGLWIRQSDTVFRPTGHGGKRSLGKNSFLEQQLDLEDASFARIYGFSYEGSYCELERPTLFLVHGEGELAAGVLQTAESARGPLNPSITGFAAAEFQFADQLMVWSYDSADHTIRMDVETGTLERVLISPFFGGNQDVKGAKISGAKVSGAKVSGAKLSGARLSGWRGDAVD
jgi:hypothetical protein